MYVIYMIMEGSDIFFSKDMNNKHYK